MMIESGNNIVDWFVNIVIVESYKKVEELIEKIGC